MADARLGRIALMRFGYGPRGDGDVRIAAGDPRGFLRAELAQPGIALLDGPALPSSAAGAQQYFADQAERKAQRERARSLADPGGDKEGTKTSDPGPTTQVAVPARPDGSIPQAAQPASPSPAPAPPKPPNPEQTIFRREALARFQRAVEVRAGFAERLVAFWSNHFCVSVAKGGIGRVTAGAFEREAIRPHVLGPFSEMLLAVASHPAMLHYLDNAQSVGPASRAGRDGRHGLNENFGRELMELHTLGVGGGFSQSDVTNLARIMTGWTMVGPPGRLGEPGTFAFNAAAHEPGTIELLGTAYPDEGVEQGRAALLALARHPRAARYIAGKFAAGFLGAPSPGLVDRLARTFQSTDGNLCALALDLIETPDAWADSSARIRTPYEFVIGSHRLVNHVPEEPGAILGMLNSLGMPLWSPPGPNGYAVDEAAWATPEGLKLRLDWSAQAAQRWHDGPNPSDLFDALTGNDPASATTRQAIARAESRSQGLALLLMSPEMQRS